MTFVKEEIIDKKIIDKNQYRLCWFCFDKCKEFVAICESCKYNKLSKIRKPTDFKKIF